MIKSIMSSYYHIKDNVSLHEYNMHNYIYNVLGRMINVPKIINYDRDSKKLTMQLIPSMSVADFYGADDFELIPVRIADEIRRTILALKTHNITYPDITGYNFIDYDYKVWIIDFEHCCFDFKGENKFVEDFIAGKVSTWNPEFE